MIPDQIPDALAENLASNFNSPVTYFDYDLDKRNSELMDIYEEHFNANNMELWNDIHIPTTEEEIKEITSKISAKKNDGPMGIKINIINNNNYQLVPLITKIMNCILLSGNVPASFRKSFLVPIPKEGPSPEITKYRGIAIQSVIPKILDTLLNKRLCEATEKILSKDQHGFRPKRSTTKSLMDTKAYIERSMKSNNQVDVVFFDMSKAFDRVDHKIIAKKLAKLATPPSIYLSLMNFVVYREYILKVDGTTTGHVIQARSGVPQGSHIGPRDYLITTDDVTRIVSPCFASAYADDLKIALKIDTYEDAFEPISTRHNSNHYRVYSFHIPAYMYSQVYVCKHSNRRVERHTLFVV